MLPFTVTVSRYRFPVPRSSRGGHQDQAKLCNGTRKFFLLRLPFPRISFVGHSLCRSHSISQTLLHIIYAYIRYRGSDTVEALPWKPTNNKLSSPSSSLAAFLLCFTVFSLFFFSGLPFRCLTDDLIKEGGANASDKRPHTANLRPKTASLTT